LRGAYIIINLGAHAPEDYGTRPWARVCICLLPL